MHPGDFPPTVPDLPPPSPIVGLKCTLDALHAIDGTSQTDAQMDICQTITLRFPLWMWPVN